MARQHLVLVNPPEHVYLVTALPVVKALEGRAVPRRIRALSAGSSDMEITRVDARTLRVKFTDGFFVDPFSRYFRSEHRPFVVGQRFELSDLSVEVRVLDEAGDPEELFYRFATTLEDPSLRWLHWTDGVYAPWSPPAVGKSVELHRSAGIFG